MSSLSLEISKYPRDLLERFNLYGPSGANLEEEEEEEEEGNEGMELELGLSLGGRFGVEKSRYSIGTYSFFKRKKLRRSSSIAGSIPPLPRDEDGALAEKVTAAVGGSQYRPTGLLRTSSLPVETEEEWRKRKEMQCLRRKDAKRRRSQKQQGGGGGASELESGKTRSSANTQSLQDRINQEAAGSSATRTNENPNITSGAKVDDRGRENTSTSAGEMPCVSTKGDGPNGRRVDGILYSYRRGEEARIMCVCHGVFHTPGEFVKHAGGRDIDNPLRHIVMNPSVPSF